MSKTIINSAVMTTYNGERFIREQLDSLMAQALLPDEVVVADDCSTDGSLSLVREFAAAHPEAEWIVYRNESNLGWEHNFKEAISRARGEYVFLCDQDDVWEPGHIADLRDAMDSHPEVDVMTSHAEPFFEEGAFKSSALETGGGESGAVARVPADRSYLIVGAPGCTYCVRKSFIGSLMPFWPDDFPHDSILYSCACLKGSLAHLDETTLRFRRHSGNASDQRAKGRGDALDLMRYYLRKNNVMRTWLMSFGEEERLDFDFDGAVALLDNNDEFTRLRIEALERPTPVSLMRLVSRAGMYPTRRSMLGDFACALFPNKEWKR